MNVLRLFYKIKAEHVVAILLVLTAVLWLLYEFALDRVMVLAPADPQSQITNVTVATDHRDGGNSTAELTSKDNVWRMDYQLKPGFPYPFANLHIDLTQNGKGLNLSQFDEIRIWASAEGFASNRIRLQLRNDHPDYTRPEDHESLKYNEVHFPPKGTDTPLKISWAHFQVTGWWIAQNNIPFKHGQVDVTNVRWIELITPEQAKDGKGFIELSKIEFRGKWISAATFYKILLVLWMVVWGVFAIAQMTRLRTLVKEKEKREQELLQLNSALAIHAKEMEQSANHDDLTGLLNRFGLRDQLFGVMDQAEHSGMKLSAIFADLDHFKRINDAHGHDEGDRILKFAAAIFKENLRETDIVARWGGEEFLIVCQGIGLDGARQLAEKLRHVLEDSPEDLTCSFGAAELAEGSFQELIKKADNALYRAKENGRNRVETAED